MASHTTLTIVFGYAVVFWCLGLPEAAGNIPTTSSQSRVARLAAVALLPTVVATFALTLLLLFAHVRALGRADAAGGGAGSRLVRRLAKATLAATIAALVAGSVLRLVADDVEWLQNME